MNFKIGDKVVPTKKNPNNGNYFGTIEEYTRAKKTGPAMKLKKNGYLTITGFLDNGDVNLEGDYFSIEDLLLYNEYKQLEFNF